MRVLIVSRTNFNTVEHPCTNIAYNAGTGMYTITLLDSSQKQYPKADYLLYILTE